MKGRPILCVEEALKIDAKILTSRGQGRALEHMVSNTLDCRSAAVKVAKSTEALFTRGLRSSTHLNSELKDPEPGLGEVDSEERGEARVLRCS